MTIPVENDWAPILKEASETASYQQLREFLKKNTKQKPSTQKKKISGKHLNGHLTAKSKLSFWDKTLIFEKTRHTD